MNRKSMYIIIIVGGIFLSISYFFALHPYVIQAYDIWMEFNYPSYGGNKGHSYCLGLEWQKKPSSFLYRQLWLPNSKPRKALALGILSGRGDARVLPILKSIILKGDPDLSFQAARCLALFGIEEAAPVFMKVINKYKDAKFYSTDKKTWKEGSRFFEALYALARLKYEPTYFIVLNLARTGTEYEKEAVFNGALYYYDNHMEEILPLYIDHLLNCPDKFKGQEILNLKYLNNPEVISVLKELAEKEPWNRDRAEEVIKYLESLKTQQEATL